MSLMETGHYGKTSPKIVSGTLNLDWRPDDTATNQTDTLLDINDDDIISRKWDEVKNGFLYSVVDDVIHRLEEYGDRLDPDDPDIDDVPIVLDSTPIYFMEPTDTIDLSLPKDNTLHIEANLLGIEATATYHICPTVTGVKKLCLDAGISNKHINHILSGDRNYEGLFDIVVGMEKEVLSKQGNELVKGTLAHVTVPSDSDDFCYVVTQKYPPESSATIMDMMNFFEWFHKIIPNSLPENYLVTQWIKPRVSW